jgi:cholestenol Delta-isomerase
MFDHWILNLTYSRPEAGYFWGYFVFLNAFWIVIPLYLLFTSVGACWRAFSALEKMEKTLKGKANGSANGSLKKVQ